MPQRREGQARSEVLRATSWGPDRSEAMPKRREGQSRGGCTSERRARARPERAMQAAPRSFVQQVHCFPAGSANQHPPAEAEAAGHPAPTPGCPAGEIGPRWASCSSAADRAPASRAWLAWCSRTEPLPPGGQPEQPSSECAASCDSSPSGNEEPASPFATVTLPPDLPSERQPRTLEWNLEAADVGQPLLLAVSSEIARNPSAISTPRRMDATLGSGKRYGSKASLSGPRLRSSSSPTDAARRTEAAYRVGQIDSRRRDRRAGAVVAGDSGVCLACRDHEGQKADINLHSVFTRGIVPAPIMKSNLIREFDFRPGYFPLAPLAQITERTIGSAPCDDRSFTRHGRPDPRPASGNPTGDCSRCKSPSFPPRCPAN